MHRSKLRNGVLTVCLVGVGVGLYFRVRHLFAPLPVNTPAVEIPAKNELNLTFTQRSPLSTMPELARRLSMDLATMGKDYDLSQCPFKAYVPDADPSAPYGIFVYLGYKDSESVAKRWEPTLDQSHLIFITPVCHCGKKYPSDVPLWQTLGLALDAVDNLSRRYKVDSNRVYLMAWNDGALQAAFGGADVFKGWIITCDSEYFYKLQTPDGRWYSPNIPAPPYDLFRKAKLCRIVLIDDESENPGGYPFLRMRDLREGGFAYLHPEELSLSSDLHYPDLNPDWFQQRVLPFLDQTPATAKN